MANTTVHLHLIRTRFVATDGWCTTCLLPSLATIEALAHFGCPPFHDSRMKYLRGTWCPECDAGGTLYPVEVSDG